MVQAVPSSVLAILFISLAAAPKSPLQKKALLQAVFMLMGLYCLLLSTRMWTDISITADAPDAPHLRAVATSNALMGFPSQTHY